MSTNRLKSIVPMFGGGASYVETLDAILEYVESSQPTKDELLGWHQGTFENVSSRKSIMRRLTYLERVGFLREEDNQWELGEAGDAYIGDHETSTLYRIMCDRNVGLRSLLYALSVGPMSIGEISDQQLDTHPELGWSRGETDMARQRANWLRSMGLIQQKGQQYELTEEGREFVKDSVGTEWTPPETSETLSTDTYETVVQARSVDAEFRATVLSRYDWTCPVSGVDHQGLLDVAHVLPWSDYPDYRGDISNVLTLSKTHHAAFDRELFTIDADYRLQVNPSFETESNVLKQTVVNRSGEPIPLPKDSINPTHLRRRNSAIEWL